MQRQTLLAAIAAVLCFLLARLIIPIGEVAAGYGAKLGCSIVFVAGRSLESALGAEFVFPPIGYVDQFTVDRVSRCVTARFLFSSTTRTACWRSERLGCSLTWPHSSTSPPTAPPGREATANDVWPEAKERAPDVDWATVDALVDAHFADSRLHARAFLLARDGELVYERYGDGCAADTRLLGWSCTKGLVNALAGTLVQANRARLDTQVWPSSGGERNVTLEQALRMSDGTDWDEWYEPGYDVDDSLFRSRSAFVPERGERTRGCFHYSSHTTNALCLWMRGLFESDGDYLSYPTEAIFEPLGIGSFVLETDPSGTFVGSSFGWAVARDWARLGQLFAQDGVWRGERLLPEGWVRMSSAPTLTSSGVYGAHFWLSREEERSNRGELARCDALYPSRLNPPRGWFRQALPPGSFTMHGFEEQLVAVVPSKGLVMVRLGATKEVVLRWERPEFYSGVLAAFPDRADGGFRFS